MTEAATEMDALDEMIGPTPLRAGQLQPVERTAPVTPMQMLQIAVERGADLDMLDKLMALQERWEAAQARKAFVAALSAFKANPPTVLKNKRAGFESRRTGDKTEYEYATLDVVCDVIGAALSQHELSHRWEVAQNPDGLIRVTCILMHGQGHSESVSLQAGADQSGSKNNIQAVGSTVTYLERYTLLAVTGLAARGQDSDAHQSGGNGNAAISDEQKNELIALIRETGADTKRFLEYFKVGSVDELRAADFADARTALLKKKKASPKETVA